MVGLVGLGEESFLSFFFPNGLAGFINSTSTRLRSDVLVESRIFVD